MSDKLKPRSGIRQGREVGRHRTRCQGLAGLAWLGDVARQRSSLNPTDFDDFDVSVWFSGCPTVAFMHTTSSSLIAKIPLHIYYYVCTTYSRMSYS